MEEDVDPVTMDHEALLGFPVVGIGASAGGLEAVNEMLAAAKPGCGIAFVLVSHLDPNHESLMAELISRSTTLTVSQIRDGDVIGPDAVFVVPPGKALTISDGRLHLRPFEAPRGLRRPIDSFFASLAVSQGPNAACVILSGTGADGTAGLRMIKEQGGVCAAQDPETARYDGMPTAALGTGLVDFELPPEDIVEALSSYFTRRSGSDVKQEARVVIDHVDQLCDTLRDVVGHDFGGYKLPTMTRRIERRMQLLDIDTADEYVAYVQDNADECDALFRDLLIHVTAFFRDPEYFERLNEQVIIPLVTSGADEVRVWVAGCSTGEEAYSIAMLIADAAKSASRKPLIQVFATDISEDMLKIAREGRYASAALLDLPERFREIYTIGLHGQFQITPRIRDMVRFSAHSLIKDPPFSRLDLISCRNLLIYMGERIQKSLIPLMHYSLKPGGHLFLGPSESLSHREDLFSPVDQKSRLFRRNSGSVSYPMNLSIGGTKRSTSGRPRRMPLSQDFPVRQRADLFSEALLERYSPSSILLSPEGEILASHGELAKFLKLSVSGTDRHVSQIARRGIRETLPPLMREAVEAGERRARRDVQVSSEFGSQKIDLIVDPLPDGTAMAVFLEVEKFRQELEEFYSEPARADDRVAELDEELRLVRFRLRGTVEELETANEELKSSNEEMMSMNEELQSANEELSTVNEELKNKVDEIGVANDDLKNFLTSAQIALISLDESLRIRSFTEKALSILPLVPADRGRSLTDVAAQIEGVDLVDVAADVLASGKPFETTVTTKTDNLTFLARILPYRMKDGAVTGVTMTFADITSVEALQREVREKGERLELALSFGDMGVWEYDPATRVATLDDIEARLIDFPPGEPVPLDEIYGRIHPDDRERVGASLDGAEHDGELYDEYFRIFHRDGTVRLLRGIGRLDANKRMIGLNFDVTQEEQTKAEKDLMFREMNHRVKNLFAVISSIISQTAKNAQSVTEMSKDLRGRILALSRAHAFTMSKEGDSEDILLRDLLLVALGSHVDGRELRLDGPEILLAPVSVTPLGLIWHELVTNSAKYGALSDANGTIGIEWTETDLGIDLRWKEEGGPIVREPKETGSFGTRLIDGSISQLGGSIERHWKPDGLVVKIQFENLATEQTRT